MLFANAQAHIFFTHARALCIHQESFDHVNDWLSEVNRYASEGTSKLLIGEASGDVYIRSASCGMFWSRGRLQQRAPRQWIFRFRVVSSSFFCDLMPIVVSFLCAIFSGLFEMFRHYAPPPKGRGLANEALLCYYHLIQRR